MKPSSLRNPESVEQLCIGRPPVEVSVPTDEIRLLLEGKTALRLDVLQASQIWKAHIGEWLGGERPDMFGGLQLRGVGREEEEVDAL
jgi:hypothetical protein